MIPQAAQRNLRSWARRGFLAVVVALCLFRLDLTFGIPTVLRNYEVDDLHFQRQAEHLVAGRWLGPYDHRTLIKGPGYPMFLAAAHRAGLPRRTAEDLLRVVAALVLLVALRRLGLPRSLALLAFAAALFSLDAFRAAMQRPAREHVYASQTLLIFALGLGTLAPGRFRARLLGALALGLGGAWFHHTREEGPWVLPAMGVLAVGLAVLEHARGRAWRGSVARAGLLASIPLLVVAAATAGLRHQNERHYGAPVITEFKDSEFTAALAALRRVTLADWSRFEPLNADRRAALYAECPTFAEMCKVIESPVYMDPATVAENGERKFAFLTWVIRDAAASVGHHDSLAESRAFYRRLADEVNAACDAGAVAAVEAVDSSHPGAHRDGWRLLLESWGQALLVPLRTRTDILGLQPGKPYTNLEPGEEARWRSFLHEGYPPAGGERQRDRLATIRSLTVFWDRVLGIAALVGVLALALSLLRPRRALRTAWFWIAAAALAAVLARTLMIAFIHTYWWNRALDYLTAVGPLVAIFPVLAIAALTDTLGLMSGRVGACVRDVVALGALVVAVGFVAADVSKERCEVVWPLSPEQLTALHQPGSRVVVSIGRLEVAARRPGLALRSSDHRAFLIAQVCDHDRVFTDAVLEMEIPGDGGTHMLRLRWAPPREISRRSSWREVLVPTGKRVALRVPLDERGVDRFLLESLPLDREVSLLTLGCVPSEVPVEAPAAVPSVRAWVSREAPRQLICQIRDAPPDSPVVVYFATRLLPNPQSGAGVEGALEIDIDTLLEDDSGGSMQVWLAPGPGGFATRTWVIPEIVSLPEGPIFLQAALAGRVLPAARVEPLMISVAGSDDLPAAEQRR